ncbi:hypothetical protein JZ785_08070 [Alicyclobacillus curvatus]|nr:hypothetical protein JZ785_08070 [Alicyclobacillus curvatus]
MVSILIYTLLLFGLIVLFFFGTRFNRRQAQPRKSQGLLNFVNSMRQANRRLFGTSVNGDVGQPRFVDEENPEVKKALRVLSDLYEEFQENIDAVREDLALTIATSHQQSEIRMKRLEDRVAQLEQQLHTMTGREAAKVQEVATGQEAAKVQEVAKDQEVATGRETARMFEAEKDHEAANASEALKAQAVTKEQEPTKVHGAANASEALKAQAVTKEQEPTKVHEAANASEALKAQEILIARETEKIQEMLGAGATFEADSIDIHLPAAPMDGPEASPGPAAWRPGANIAPRRDATARGTRIVEPQYSAGPSASGTYSEILNQLRMGKSREEIARSLGVGLTEVDIVGRVFLPVQSNRN